MDEKLVEDSKFPYWLRHCSKLSMNSINTTCYIVNTDGTRTAIKATKLAVFKDEEDNIDE